MKFVSIDLETTGLDHSYCQMIELGAVIDDLQNPKPLNKLQTFHCYVLRDRYIGEPYALSMHAEIFRRIATKAPGFNYYTPKDALFNFNHFLGSNGMIGKEQISTSKVNVTGKNFSGFDLNFLRNDWGEAVGKFRHRVLDPGSLYFRPETDSELPNMKVCMSRAGLEEEVAHTALEDALAVIKLVRRYYNVEG